MFQNFLIRTMLKKKLAGLPQDQQDKVMKVLEEKPELFMQIAEKVQTKVKSGMREQDAMLSVFGEHKDELAALFK